MARQRKVPQDIAPVIAAVKAPDDGLVPVMITHGDVVTLDGGRTAAPQEPVRVTADLAAALIEKGLANRG